MLKTLLGSGHLLPGSLEGLQHGVHTGEKRGRAESIHQELSVISSSTSTWIAPHQKCFCLDRVKIIKSDEIVIHLVDNVEGDGDTTTGDGREP